MLSSTNHLAPVVFHYEFNLIYDTPVVCGFSISKGLKVNPRCVTSSHHINDQLPKFCGLIPPTEVKDPIGNIETTHRNTFVCSFFEKLEVKSTMFHSKFTNLSPSIELTKNSSKPKYDIDTTQNISTRIFKKLYTMRPKLSKYTPRLVQLLDDSDDFSPLVHMQGKYQTCYNCTLYNA